MKIDSNRLDMIQITEMQQIITRKEALQQGLSLYFTGKPCAQGHIDARRASDRKCQECNRLRSERWRMQNFERVKELNDAHYAANREQRKARQREWNAANASYAAKYAQQYRDANPDIARIWRQANKQRVVLYTTRRRAAKLQRTPAWADATAIDAFYLDCPAGMHVDHVIPLRGRLVSGLHVLNNLQYLANIDNMRKGNKFDPWTFKI